MKGFKDKKETNYIFLVRHGKRVRDWKHEESEHELEGFKDNKPSINQDGKSKKSGYGQLLYLAGILCDQLSVEINEMKQYTESNRETFRPKTFAIKILHSNHMVAKQTAETFKQVFNQRNIHVDLNPYSRLTPEYDQTVDDNHKSDGNKNGKDNEAWLPIFDEMERFNVPGDPYIKAMLLVGHQPMLYEIGRVFCNGKLPGEVLPLANGELACLRKKPGEKYFRLVWMLTEKGDDVLNQLKEKVKSKFEVAKFFLGAFIVNNAILLNQNVWEIAQRQNKWVLSFALIAAVASLAFTAFTLFAYDRLLMPFAFWGSKSGTKKNNNPPPWSIARPPGQGHVILYMEMVHAWTYLFMPALVLAYISLSTFMSVIICENLMKICYPCNAWIVVAILAGIAYLLFYIFYKRWTPKLGFED